MKGMGKRAWIALALAALLALGGCGGSEPEEEEAEAPAPPEAAEPLPEPEPEEAVPAGTNPLTGEPMDPEQETLRPVAVLFNNLKAAQPQLGVSGADILYEVPAEGGITRMLGVFQTLEGAETLGSIRSARPYYLELALAHDALLVHAGGSPEAYRDIPAWGVDNMDGVNGGSDAEIFWRDPDRRKSMGYEHSMVTSGENVLAYLAEGHFETEHGGSWTEPLTFGESSAAGGETAEQVTVRFSNYKTGTFDYDAGSGLYLAGQYGAPHLDGATGQRVSAANVLVLETSISVISGDKEGRLSVKLTGEGKGTYFSGGRAVPVRWSREDRYSPFRYTLEDGSPLVLAAGKSYVCIISPKTSTLTYS